MDPLDRTIDRHESNAALSIEGIDAASVSRAIANHHHKADLTTLTDSSHGTILRRLFPPTRAHTLQVII